MRGALGGPAGETVEERGREGHGGGGDGQLDNEAEDDEEGEHGERRAKTYEINLLRCIFCGFCEEACPVDAIVETRVYEYIGDTRDDLLMTKEKLLAMGDEHEAQIAADRAVDAPYR